MWTNVNTGVDTRTTTFIDINDIGDEWLSNIKFFVGDTMSFSVVHNIDSSAAELNNDCGVYYR